MLFGTGEGQTTPPGSDGALALATPVPKPVAEVSITIDGQPAEILYAGSAPGSVAGLFQVNVRIPASAGTGAVPVVLTVGSVHSQAGLTMQLR